MVSTTQVTTAAWKPELVPVASTRARRLRAVPTTESWTSTADLAVTAAATATFPMIPARSEKHDPGPSAWRPPI